MSPHDEITPADDHALERYLTARGLSVDARRRGLHGLVAAWESMARGAAGYDLTLDDWRNDLDVRDIIAGALAVASTNDLRATRDALHRADALFRTATVDAGRALWSAEDDPTDQVEMDRPWWYRRRPAQPGDRLRSDLETEGLL